MHNTSSKRIKILEGSTLNINAIFDKDIKSSNLIFNKDSLIKLENISKKINHKIDVFSSFELKLEFVDFDNV